MAPRKKKNPNAKTVEEMKNVEGSMIGKTIEPVVVPSDAERLKTKQERESKEQQEKPVKAPVVKKPVRGRPFPKKAQPLGPTSGAPTFVGTNKPNDYLSSKETKPVSKRKRKTKSGTNLDRGRVPVPSVTRDETTGKIRATTSKERGDAGARVVLPDATAQQKQVNQPVAPVNIPTKSKLVGTSTAVSHDILHGLSQQAFTHLGRMSETHGMEEHHGHNEAFNQVHATISAGDSQLGTMFGIAGHAVKNPNHPQSAQALTMAKSAIDERLGQIKQMAGYASEADSKNRSERAQRIAAYKAGKE